MQNVREELMRLGLFARMDKLEREMKIVMSNQQDLDASVAQLTSTVSALSAGITALSTDWEALKTKLANGLDLTNEVDAINKAISDLQAATTTVSTTDSDVQAEGGTPPAPAPAPAGDQPAQ